MWQRVLPIFVGGVIVIGLAVWLVLRPAPPSEMTAVEPSPITTPSEETTEIPSAFTRVYAQEIEGAAGEFTFSLEVPTGWQAEAIPALETINVYDPTAPGESKLEQAQLFIRHFEANGFLTLQTVTIHERTDVVVNGRPAVCYDIEKKGGVTDFPNQPSWRNQRHIVTDVRVSDDNPSTFYVIAKRPDLDESTYQHVLDSLKVIDLQG